MADNVRTLEDEDGDQPDWIEICNSSTGTVNLSGWYLTDKSSKPDKWMFPAVTLAAGARMVVFASEKDRRNPRYPLHTNFKLDAGGEYLALIRPNLSIAHEFAREYPPQAPDVSYGMPETTSRTKLLAQGAPGRANSPSSLAVFTNSYNGWNTSLAFNDSGWQSGGTGFGYDNDGTYGSLLGTNGDIKAITYRTNCSFFMRLKFVATNVSHIAGLWYRTKHDDGYRAYLNGTAVSEDAAPASPAWNSAATMNRDEDLNNSWTEHAVTNGPSLLLEGTNLLAIQGFNINLTSSDLLVLPELECVYDLAGSPAVYQQTPTPGTANAGGSATIGPVIRDATERADPPVGGTGSPPIAVSAVVTPSMGPVTAVKLAYRFMFDAEVVVNMTAVSNGLYTASIPTINRAAGTMIRWRFIAIDDQSRTNTAPVYADPLNYDQYYGTVVNNPSLTNSRLPAVHWFVQDYAAAGTEGGTRCSLYYDGRFYDNIFFNLHGQSTAGFNKKSYNVDFNYNNRFEWRAGEKAVKDVKFMTNWGDKSKVHNSLTHETFRNVGAGHHFSFQVRMQRNGAFFSVTDMMEDADDRWLERLGLDPEGALYKMYNGLTSASGNEKKTRLYEGTTDLFVLITNLYTGVPLDTRRRYAYDNLDIPFCLNYFAGANIVSHQDHGHKNFYMYRDTPGTGEWAIFPWDTDLTWGRNWIQQYSGSNYLNDVLFQTNSLDFNTPQQVKEYCRLYQLFHFAPELRQMYFRRLRTCMDRFLQTNGTPYELRYAENRMDQMADLVDPPGVTNSDAALDYSAWGSWGTPRTMRQELDRTKQVHLAGRRDFLYNSIPHVPLIAGEGIPAPQPTNAVILVETIDYMPSSGNPLEEYFTLLNTNDYAVDISGWSVTGAVRHTFREGTVIPSGGGATQNVGRLFVARDTVAFRGRAGGPSSNQFCQVQGGYDGQLSARGETVFLLDDTGRPVDQRGFGPSTTDGQLWLRVSEVMYAPGAPTAAEKASDPYLQDTDFEYIELVNTGANSLSIGNASFSQGVLFTFPAGVTLAAGERIVVAANTNAFRLRYGPSGRVVGPYDGFLDNGGETLQLLDSVGEEILQFRYDGDWQPLTAGLGFSLVIRDEGADWTAWEDEAAWRQSAATAGSPGAADPVPPVHPRVRLTEVLAHTDPPLMDSVELYNAESVPAAIGGWLLTDDFDQPRKYVIPPGIVLQPGERRVFDETHFNTNTNLPECFSFSSVGDDVWLFSADSQTNLTGYFDGCGFGATPNGVTIGFFTNSIGIAHWPLQSARTLGSANAYPLVGPVVVSAVMFHPPDLGGANNDRDEFVELANIGPTNVPLFDVSAPTNTWRLRGAVDFDFPAGVWMPAGGRLLVTGSPATNAADRSAFLAAYALSPTNVLYGPWSGRLANEGETIRLERPDTPNPDLVPYVLLETVSYEPGTNWTTGASGTGRVLQRIDTALFADEPENWYAAAPTPLAPADLACDTDGDGQPDWAEWRARTDAADANSSMRMIGTHSGVDGALTVRWASVPGRFYGLEFSTNLLEQPAFQDLKSPIPAAGAETVYTDTNAPSSGLMFYRIRLSP